MLHVGKSLLQIWKLRFGHKAFVQTLSTLVKIFSDSEHFGQDFEVEVEPYTFCILCITNAHINLHKPQPHMPSYKEFPRCDLILTSNSAF